MFCILGIFKCDFNDDWCDFENNRVNDIILGRIFNWKRTTSDELKEEEFLGPEKGAEEIHDLSSIIT